MDELKEDFNIKHFNIEWIEKCIDKHSIHFMEGLGIWLCGKEVSFDKEKKQYYTQSRFFDEKLGMTVSQIRNIFGEIKRIKAKGFDNSTTDFLLLKPKVAYNTARVSSNSRTRNSRISDFKTVFENAHKSVNNQETFDRFSDFFEGIIAYHKVYGGKD